MKNSTLFFSILLIISLIVFEYFRRLYFLKYILTLFKKKKERCITIFFFILISISFSPKEIVAQTVNYYSTTTSIVNETSSWWTNTDGTGDNPANFTDANQVFVVQSGHSITASGEWNVTGSNSKVLIKTGGKISTKLFNHHITLDLESGAEYQVDHTGWGSVSIGSWDKNSIIRFTNNSINLRSINHPSVIIDFSNGTKSIGSGKTFNVLGDLTIRSGTFKIAGTSGTAILNLGGGLIIDGGNFSTGSARGTLNFTNDGKASGDILINSGTLTLGSGTGENADVITIDSGRTVGLSSNVDIGSGSSFTINGTVHFSGGSLNTGSNTLTLGPTGTISGEDAGSYLIGNLTTTRSIGTSSSDFGGIGVNISAGEDDLGDVIVTRVSGTAGIVTSPADNSKTGIAKKWTIVSSNPPLSGRDLTLSWISSDDNSKDLTTAQVWKSEDNGITWNTVGALQNASSTRSITINTTSFSEWTVSDANNPVPVELISFTGKLISNKVYLNWSTATEINNYGLEIDRKVISKVNGMGDKQNEDENSQSSFDNSQWVKIGFVCGHGNSNSTKLYSFVDPLFDIGESDLRNGECYYRLKQIDNDGSFKYSSKIEVKLNVPPGYILEQNYPNPFNPSTVINFKLAGDNHVHLKVYNILGKEVATLLDENRKAGIHNVNFNTGSLGSGIYFYKLTAGNYSNTKKMIIMK